MSSLELMRRWRLLVRVIEARARSWRGRSGRSEKRGLDVKERTPIQTFYPGKLFDPLGIRLGLEASGQIPASGLSPRCQPWNGRKLAGRVVRLELDPARSFFGDCLQVVDTPGEKPPMADLPAFGASSKPLLGGYAITSSALSGSIELRFSGHEAPEAAEGFLPFSLRIVGSFEGRDTFLTAPNGYRLDVRRNEVSNSQEISKGLLELATGRLYDFHLAVIFSNTAIEALERCNFGLEALPLDFPGLPHAGHNIGHLARDEATGAITFVVAAQLFLPLGEGSAESPLLMPGDGQRSPFPARNSSLHPYIQIAASSAAEMSTQKNIVVRKATGTSALSPPLPAAPSSPKRGESSSVSALFAALQNSVRHLKIASPCSYFGDVFALRAPAFEEGRPGRGQSPLFGELGLQFGVIHHGLLPFTLWLRPGHTAFASRFDKPLALLPPGTREGLIGLRGRLTYGRHAYEQSGLCLMSDAQKLSIGAIDVASGDIVAPFVMRLYLFLSLFEDLVLTEPRTPTDSFAYSCRGSFSWHQGRLHLDIQGETHIPYPSGYRFPVGRGHTVVDEGSYLAPFLRLTAGEVDSGELVDPPLDLRSRYEVREIHRGHGEGTNLEACRIEGGRLVLEHHQGQVEAKILARHRLSWAENECWLFEARAPRVAFRRPQALLMALQTKPSPRLVLASENENLDCDSAGHI